LTPFSRATLGADANPAPLTLTVTISQMAPADRCAPATKPSHAGGFCAPRALGGPHFRSRSTASPDLQAPPNLAQAECYPIGFTCNLEVEANLPPSDLSRHPSQFVSCETSTAHRSVPSSRRLCRSFGYQGAPSTNPAPVSHATHDETETDPQRRTLTRPKLPSPRPLFHVKPQRHARPAPLRAARLALPRIRELLARNLSQLTNQGGPASL